MFLYKDYRALVVGISDYDKWPDLPFAIQDAEEVTSKLDKMGFQVKLVTNPTSREFKKILSEMTYKMGKEPNRAVLFYYAGHGETETMADGTKMGYIIPKDCPPLKGDPVGFDTHAVSMRDIESVSLRMKSKHVLMLFDSCFSGALFSLVRAMPVDITEKSALPVRQYITAGNENEQVPDKSMFKRCFLIGLDGAADMTGDGYITGSEMGMYLADNVVNYTRRQQHPQYGKINNPNLDQGDFIFIPPKTLEKQKNREQSTFKREDLVNKDIQQLRAERKETHRLLVEMKKLVQTQQQAPQQGKQTLQEKMALERQIAKLAKEREAFEELAAAREKEYEARLTHSKEKVDQEAQKRKAMQAELERLRQQAEKRKALEQELEKLKRERGAKSKANQKLQERKALERQIAKLAKERETIEKLAAAREKEYEARLTHSKEKVDQEAQKRKAMQAELERLRQQAEKRKALEQELEKLRRERNTKFKANQKQVIQSKDNIALEQESGLPANAKKEEPLLISQKGIAASGSKTSITKPVKEGIQQEAGTAKTQNEVYVPRIKVPPNLQLTLAPKKPETKPIKKSIQQGTETAKTQNEVYVPKIKVPTNLQLAYAPKKSDPEKIVRAVLRRKPIRMDESDIEKMILHHNFYSKKLNEKGGFLKNFSDNRDGTVTDHSTGLMWERGGSSSKRNYFEVENYIADLNDDKFAAHDDWRLPTLEELSSLMTKAHEKTGMYLDPIFESSKKTCWSADSSADEATETAYYVDFSDGVIVLGYGRNESSRYEIVEAINFVKAVRSIK